MGEGGKRSPDFIHTQVTDAGMQKAFTLNVEDSNCAKIGIPEDKQARKGAAETEPAWQGSGQGERQAPHTRGP